MQWRSAVKIISRNFDDGLLVYHETSGETHMLVGISKPFLDYCCSGAIFSLKELSDWAGQTNSIGYDCNLLPNDLTLALEKLSDINLIEPVCCEYES